jgi:hypothetical protein
MSATDAPPASMAMPGTLQTSARHGQGAAFNAGDLGVARMLFVDIRVRSLLMGEARRRAVTRVFGVPSDDQSLLVTMILLGAAGSVVRGFAPRPWPRPSGVHAAVGASLLDAMLRGIAGAPSRNVPVAGGLIALALLSRSLRPAVVGSAREVRALAHEMRAAFGARYRPADPPG